MIKLEITLIKIIIVNVLIRNSLLDLKPYNQNERTRILKMKYNKNARHKRNTEFLARFFSLDATNKLIVLILMITIRNE
jgi:hypothetical protein